MTGKQSGDPSGFERLFENDDDPWGFRSRWYERRKRAVTLAALPAERVGSIFEPGCANGELAAALAERCDRLLASDGIERAVTLARERLRGYAHAEVRRAWMPQDWPDEKFDVIVISELVYFIEPHAIDQLAGLAREALRPDGCVVACHWRRAIHGFALSGEAAHARLLQGLGLNRSAHYGDDDFQLDVCSQGAASVAMRDGIC